jgi:hypothetical protein
VKFVLRAGETVETLSPDELRHLLDRVADRFVLSVDETYLNPSQAVLSAAGTASWVIAECPPGFNMRVSRITFESPAGTPGAPYSAAGAYVAYRRDDPNTPVLDFTVNPAIFPTLFSYGSNDAPIIRPSSQVIAQVVNGPAGGLVVCQFQAALEVARTAVGRP